MNKMINDISKIYSESHSAGTGVGIGAVYSLESSQKGDEKSIDASVIGANGNHKGTRISEKNHYIRKFYSMGNGWGTGSSKNGEGYNLGFGDGSKNNSGDSLGNG